MFHFVSLIWSSVCVCRFCKLLITFSISQKTSFKTQVWIWKNTFGWQICWLIWSAAFPVPGLMCPGKETNGPEWAEKVTLCHRLHIGPKKQINSSCLRQPKYMPEKKSTPLQMGRQSHKICFKSPRAWMDFQVLHDIQWHLCGRQRSHCLTSLV